MQKFELPSVITDLLRKLEERFNRAMQLHRDTLRAFHEEKMAALEAESCYASLAKSAANTLDVISAMLEELLAGKLGLPKGTKLVIEREDNFFKLLDFFILEETDPHDAYTQLIQHDDFQVLYDEMFENCEDSDVEQLLETSRLFGTIVTNSVVGEKWMKEFFPVLMSHMRHND